ncbi:hypothetical protein ACF0H5_007451 [Mactra antiquata]
MDKTNQDNEKESPRITPENKHHGGRKQSGKVGVFLVKKFLRLLTVICWALFFMFLLMNFMPSSLKLYNAQPGVYKPIPEQEKYFYIDHDIERTSNRTEILLSLFNGNVALYSAIGYNLTSGNHYDAIYLSGWENQYWAKKISGNYTCCLLYNNNGNNNIVGSRLHARNHWYYLGRAKQEVKQFICGNVLHRKKTAPVAISLGVNRKCPKDFANYVKVYYPKKQDGDKIGVCAKLIYGNIKASLLIEWFEYQRYMGVSKVVSYTQNLTRAALAVLEYYKKEGLSEDFPYDLPILDGKKRYVGVKNMQGWNDEQVAVYDCQGRLSGYKYIGLYDTDEFIYPKLDSDMLSLMRTLETQHPKAGGFSFKTEIYASTWGVDNSSEAIDDVTIGQYTLRTESYRDRVKSIVRAERLIPGRLSTHGYWATNPYRKPFVDSELATLKHYRTCRKEWLRKGGDKCYMATKIIDTSMLQIAATLKPRINKVKTILGIAR